MRLRLGLGHRDCLKQPIGRLFGSNQLFCRFASFSELKRPLDEHGAALIGAVQHETRVGLVGLLALTG